MVTDEMVDAMLSHMRVNDLYEGDEYADWGMEIARACVRALEREARAEPPVTFAKRYTDVVVADARGYNAGDPIRIGDEWLRIVRKQGNTLTCRALKGKR
jgi:hypothetical protein